MPHLKSAKKRMRQNLKRRDHNRAVKKSLKKQLKSVFEVGGDTAGTMDELKKEATAAIKKLDKAAARRVIHPNTAARKKSQIARLINAKAKAPPAAPASHPPLPPAEPCQISKSTPHAPRRSAQNQ